MHTNAVVLSAPGSLSVRALQLVEPAAGDVVVDTLWSGISTGTERLLYTGTMPPFPGMGYPLVPGYETVGRVRRAGPEAAVAVGDMVFVPGADCYDGARGLFGGAASRIVTRAERVVPVPEQLGESACLLALAATARHAIALPGAGLPDLIIGHGVLGRLLARLILAAGGAPLVWETNTDRHAGAQGYAVVHPDADARRDYRVILDASGDAALLDALISRLAPGGTIILAGFYTSAISFAFPPAFMREARILIAAQWQRADLLHVSEMAADGRLSLTGLITNHASPGHAEQAYRTAFSDSDCLKMIVDWSAAA